MYKKLKKRLILMYWITASIILFGIMGAVLLFNYREERKKQINLFFINSENFLEQMQRTQYIQVATIKQLEIKNRWYLWVQQQDVDLEITNSQKFQKKPDELKAILTDKIIKSNVDFFNIIDLNGKKVSNIIRIAKSGVYTYYGRIAQVDTSDALCTFTIIQEINLWGTNMQRITLMLVGCDFVGTILLLILSIAYVNSVLRPAEEANEKQKEFIAAVSHELRSPLAVIKVGIGNIKNDVGTGQTDRLGSYIYPIESECVRMSRLIEDMLLLAATDQKSWTIKREEVDPETLLIECYDAFCMMNQEHQDKIQIDLSEEELPKIQGDAQRIKQVILILLDNAMSYTELSLGIILRAYCDQSQSHVIIEIEDHGRGIPEEEKAKIFDCFYRRESSRSDQKHFGLGLSIAKRLVELHNGTIVVKDTKEHGTTFVIELPAVNECETD